MSSIPYNRHKENEIFDFVSKFINEFQIGKLLFQCNAGKEKGIPVMTIFRYLLCLLFSDRSHYMQRKTKTFEEGFSKNTLYRFLNSVKTNWQRFTLGWSDGNSFVPVTYCLLLAAENKNLICPAKNSMAVPLLENAAANCAGKRLMSCWN